MGSRMTHTNKFTYSAVMKPIDGEDDCGDQYLVKELSRATLVAVADGLGHGKHAAFAAKKAMAVLKTSKEESLVSLIHECHEALKHTRGVVMSLVHFTKDTISWLGVGNVIGMHWGMDTNRQITTTLLNSFGGVIGMNLPHLKVMTLNIAYGDTLIIATDGILSEFTTLKPMPYALPQTIAQEIFNSYQNKMDDALVFVGRWSSAVEESAYEKQQ